MMPTWDTLTATWDDTDRVASVRAAALAWLAIPEGSTGPDVDAAGPVAAAVAAFVAGLPSIRLEADGTTWAPQTVLGATMLAARLIRRRNSPAGVEAFSDTGATYVSRHDPDVSLMLRIEKHAAPMIG